MEGLLSGSPMIDVRVSVFDGKEHPVDSKEIAFKSAGKEAFKLAAAKAHPVLTEPIYNLEIVVPDQFAGDIMSDMSTRRGRVQGRRRRRADRREGRQGDDSGIRDPGEQGEHRVHGSRWGAPGEAAVHVRAP